MKKVRFFKVNYSKNYFELVLTEMDVTAEQIETKIVNKIREKHGVDFDLIRITVQEISRETFVNLTLVDSLECKLFDIPN